MDLKVIFLCCAFLSLTLGKMEIILDEKLEKCVDAKDEAGYYDTSHFEMIAESDTSVFLNGSIVFVRGIEAPWALHVYAEKYDRGQWFLTAIDKKFPDFCAVMHKPTEIWYPYLKDFKGCPLKPGDFWQYDMMPAVGDHPIVFPPHFSGQWRMTVTGKYEIDGVLKTECYRSFFQMVDSTFAG